jgi:hypothetical protein
MGVMGAGGQLAAREGLRQRIEEQLKMRMAEQQMALAQRGADRADRALEQNDAYRRDALDERSAIASGVAQDRQTGLANALGDQVPEGAFIAPTDPIVGMLRMGGRGSLLQEQQERPQVDEGPLLPGDTGAPKQQGFLKMASEKQQDTQIDNDRAAAAEDRAARNLERQETADTETARYHERMLNKPSAADAKKQWVMRGGVPVETDQTQPGDTPYRAPQSISENAQDRQRKARTQAAKGFLDRLNTLREKINTKMGPAAGIGGTARRGAAAIGLDPDVAEYERIRAAGGRSLAVAIMGAQNLSDADASAWAGMLPGATVDKETAKRLMDQVGTMLTSMDEGGAPPPAAGAQEFDFVDGKLVPRKP